MIKRKGTFLFTFFYWFGRTSVFCLRIRERSKHRSSG